MGKIALFVLSWWLSTTPTIPYRTLTWQDFKGTPTNSHLASSCTGIVIEKDTAYAVFEPDRSWTRTNDAATLRHEQGHFRITQTWSLFISDRMKYKYKGSNNNNLTVDDFLKGWNDEQTRYDLETDHGANVEAQKLWEKQIKL